MGYIIKCLFTIAIVFALGKFLFTQFIPRIFEIIKLILEYILSPFIFIFMGIQHILSDLFSFLIAPFQWFFGLFM